MSYTPRGRKGLHLFLSALLVALGAWSGADAAVFSNPAAITIPAGAPGATQGTAAPYPSTITVSGMSGPITHVEVTLNHVGHTSMADIDVLLVGPGGQKVELMELAGSGGVSDSTWTFRDGGPAMPFFAPSGIYGPTVNATGPYPPTAPAPPYATALSSLNGADPNGVWQLFVNDDYNLDSGAIAGGWSLTITTISANPAGIPTLGLWGLALLALLLTASGVRAVISRQASRVGSEP